MKDIFIKILFLTNHVLSIFSITYIIVQQDKFSIQSLVPLFLATIFLIEVTYIVSCNIKDSKVLNLFSGVLVINSWYLIYSISIASQSTLLYFFLIPINIFSSMKFYFLFIFQGYNYRNKTITDYLLLILCVGSIISKFISDQLYFSLLSIQIITSIVSFILLTFYHWERVKFIIKVEWKTIVLTLICILFTVIFYGNITNNLNNSLENFGMYIVICTYSMIIHGIFFKEKSEIPLLTIFTLKQLCLFLFSTICILYTITLLLGMQLSIFFVFINIFFAFIFFVNIILEENLKKKYILVSNKSQYFHALNQLQNEEKLKKEFANFLHDEILQDLLSIKNMVGSSSRLEVQRIIYESLDSLNIHIRSQMQNYYPIILKTLTLKENFENLIEGVSKTFINKNIKIFFNCSDKLFIAKPYDVLVYRWFKELLTNSFKHSNGDCVWISLVIVRNILHLKVSDNGEEYSKLEKIEKINLINHKGLLSIKEQVEKIGGDITLSRNTFGGLCIDIRIRIEGGDSYKYFVD